MFKQICTLALAGCLALASCSDGPKGASRGKGAPAARVQVERPQAMPPPGGQASTANTGAAARGSLAPPLQPGAPRDQSRLPGGANARIQPPSGNALANQRALPTTPSIQPTTDQLPTLPANVENVTSVTQYDAQQMITAFAQQYLGFQPTVTRAGGVGGSVTLPAGAAEEVNANIALAGQVAAGMITANGNPGAAEVAVGSGTISGDLQADISGASQGAYSLLLMSTGMPPDEATALNLIYANFPALANVGLQAETSAQGYLFRAVTTHEGIDWQSKQLTLITEVVLAGVSGQGRSAIVWAVVANGTFAAQM